MLVFCKSDSVKLKKKNVFSCIIDKKLKKIDVDLLQLYVPLMNSEHMDTVKEKNKEMKSNRPPNK